MSNNKQSSVEWLMDKLFDPSYMQREQLEWFEQAKEMHKKEIIDANFDAQPFREYTMTDSRKISEHYYKEKFDK